MEPLTKKNNSPVRQELIERLRAFTNPNSVTGRPLPFHGLPDQALDWQNQNCRAGGHGGCAQRRGRYLSRTQSWNWQEGDVLVVAEKATATAPYWEITGVSALSLIRAEGCSD